MRAVFRSFPLKIFLLALILRLVPVIALRNMGIGLDDMFQYDMLARSLVSGNGYRWYAYDDLKLLQDFVEFDLSSVDYDPVRGVPTSFRAPLYPLFLALVYSVAGIGQERFLAARLVQTILGASLAPLTYGVSRALFPGDSPDAGKTRERGAVISGWIVACYPLLILYPFGLATENLFFPLVLLSFLFLLKSADNPTLTNSILSGLFLALAALTRSIILPFTGLAILWVWFRLKDKRGAIAIALTMLVLIAPWVVRNSLLQKRLTWIESSMGYNLYMGYHPESNGSFTFGVSLDLLPILNDAERDRVGTQKALEFIEDDPGRFLPLALNRLGFFFGLEKRVLMYFYANNFLGYIPTIPLSLAAILMLLPFVLIAVSTPFGLVILHNSSKTTLLWIFFLAYLLPHVFILSEDRFHLAIIPLVACLAAFSWVSGWGQLQKRWAESGSGKALVFLAVAAAGLLFINWGWELFREMDKLVALFGPNGNTLYLPY